MEAKICQIVDSSGGLPQEFIETHKIEVIPFYFKFEATDYLREHIDYTADEFFKHMEDYPDDVPKTAAPSPHDWLESFERNYKKGSRKYIVTTISSKLSNSFQSANVAKEMFIEKNKDVSIEIIDSNTCAAGQAALEIGIAKLLDLGKDFDFIIEKIHKMISKLNTIFVVETLKYMNAGGRIGGATAFLGKLINIKPISEFVNGQVKVIKPVIGRKKSLKEMVDIAISRVKDIEKAIIIIQNANSKEDAKYLYDYLIEKTKTNMEIFTSNLGITVGAHSGPGTIGIGIFEQE